MSERAAGRSASRHARRGAPITVAPAGSSVSRHARPESPVPQPVHQPDLGQWSSLTPPRPSPVRRAAALAAIRYMARDLPASISISGRRYGNDGPELTVHRPGPFLDRISRDAGTGFGEAFLAGDWDPAPGTDLAELLLPFAERFGADKESGLLPPWAQTLRGMATRTHPADSDNDRTQAQVNVNRHYGLDNSMFSEFLDNSMTYSCAMFDPEPDAPSSYPELHPAEPPTYKDLEPAQLRKLDAVLDAAGVRSGSRVLEIGCGWGSLAIRAAQRGAWVTAITIGNRQAVQAQHRIDDAGVRDRVKIALRDYRDQIGEFDAVLSVEMIEAVGEKYWPVYFGVIERRLAPGGIAVMQAIVMPHERMLATKDTYTWVQKYIFPGGLLPSVRAIEEVNAQYTGLQTEVLRRLGTHYGPTLRLWRERFGERWPQVEELGFDPTFRRMWELYLAYSEAGFRAGYLDDVQVRLTRR